MSRTATKPPTRDQARAAVLTLAAVRGGYPNHLEGTESLSLHVAAAALMKHAGHGHRVRGEKSAAVDLPDPPTAFAPAYLRPAHTRTRAALDAVRRLVATRPELWADMNGRTAAEEVPAFLERILAETEDVNGGRRYAGGGWS